MTEQNTDTTQAPESLIDERTSDADTPDTTDTGALGGTETASNPNAEAAKYRVRAREAEAALATAQARIELLHRLDIERLAGAHLSAPQDIWLSGNQPVDYIGEGGYVDAERVREDAALLLQERPGLSKRQPAVDPSQGHGSTPPKAATPSWSVLLKD